MANLPENEKAKLMDDVEYAMSIGYEEAAQVWHRVPGITDLRTAEKYIGLVKDRWENRPLSEDVDKQRAKTVIKYENLLKSLGLIIKSEVKTSDKIQAARTAITAIERIAEMKGIKPPEQHEHVHFTQELIAIAEESDSAMAEELKDILTVSEDKQ